MGDLSPIQRGLRIGRKGADQSDRTIGHNGEQILIPEIVAAAKRRELAPFRPRRSLPDRYLPGGVNGKIDVLRFANANTEAVPWKYLQRGWGEVRYRAAAIRKS
jgi:hypothetical protein